MPPLHTSDRRVSVDINKKVCEGGEGIVYRTNDPDLVGKVYKQGACSPEKEAKLRVMIANPPADPGKPQNHVSIAWPRDVLRDQRGRFGGYVMPAIKGEKLDYVTWPNQRKKHFPQFDWESQHNVAANVAKIFGAVHDRGYVIGDVKKDNILINSKGFVTTLDTDSYQVQDRVSGKDFLCRVTSEDYTPPELSDTDAVREIYQDFHGLGVLLYQLLLCGSHPVQGTWEGRGEEPPTSEKIKRGYFPFAPRSPLRLGPLISLDVLNPLLQTLFRRCFIEGRTTPSQRPSPREWLEALEETIQALDKCRHGHVYAPSYGRCVWCERKQRLGVEDFTASLNPRIPLRQRVREVLTALKAGDERKAAQIWQAHTEIHGAQELQSQKFRLVALVSLIEAFDRFCEVYRRDCDDIHELTRLWSPELASSLMVTRERIGGRSVKEIGASVERRMKAFSALENTIAVVGTAPFSWQSETRIVEQWNQGSKDIPLNASFMADIAPRIKQALFRLSAYEALSSAIRQDDDRAILRAWPSSSAMLRGLALAPSEAERLRQSRARIKAVDRLVACLAQHPDAEEEVVHIWSSEALLKGSRIVEVERLGTLTVEERVKLALRRIEAVQKVLDAISAQDRQFQQHGVLLSILEASICEVFERGRAFLSGSEYAETRVSSRSRLARQRLDQADRLITALHAGDERGVDAAWGDGTLLMNLDTISTHAARASEIAGQVAELEQIEALFAKNPFDDEGILGAWQQSKRLRESALGKKPSEHLDISTPQQRRLLSPQELADRARQRQQILEIVMSVEHRGAMDPLLVAEHWNEELCGQAPAFGPLLPAIRSACDRARPALDLISACDCGDDADICERLESCSSSSVEIPEKYIPRIRQALVAFKMRNLEIGQGQWNPPVFNDRTVNFKWPWTNKAVQLCWVSIGNGLFPVPPVDLAHPKETEQLVTFDAHRNLGVTFDLEGDSANICVWPIVLFRGERLLGQNVMNNVLRRPIKITYSVHHGVFGGYALKIVNLSRREVDLPPLKLVSREKRPPTSAVDGEHVLLEIPPMRLDINRSFDFLKPLALRDRHVFLGLFSDALATWIDIQHSLGDSQI